MATTMTVYDLVMELTEVGKQLDKSGFKEEKAKSIKMMQENPVDKKVYPLEFKKIELHTLNGELVAVIKNKY
jgi:hypothetical protein